MFEWVGMTLLKRFKKIRFILRLKLKAFRCVIVLIGIQSNEDENLSKTPANSWTEPLKEISQPQKLDGRKLTITSSYKSTL